MSRILGLDYGEKRMGLAISDAGGVIAMPLRVIESRNPDQSIDGILNACKETKAEKLVVGLPRNMDGSEGFQAKNVRAFIEKLVPRLSIPIETWDERLSTKSANDVLIAAGTRRERRKDVVDKLAAQIMLQNYLDAHAAPPETHFAP
jgi:putative Holliday junction resolvase